MRLAQLARKLGMKSSDIVEFLARQNYAIEDSSNAKLPDEQVEWIMQKFSTSHTHETENIVKDLPETALEVIPVQEVSEEIPPSSESVLEADANPQGNAEIIRAYKIELPGLKVVGKIALPEPKVKEEVKEEEISARKSEAPIEKTGATNRKKKSSYTAQSERKPRKNPIAVKRELEEREARERREAQRTREKELRTRRYQEKVGKYTPPSKPMARLNKEDYEVYEEKAGQKAPKTWLGKIASWFVAD